MVNVYNRVMEKRKVLGVTILILVLAVYLVQNPNFSALQLRENLKDKVIVICGASSGEYNVHKH